MNKYWIIFIVSVSSAAAYWDEDYDYPRNLHYFDSSHSGYHDYHPPHNYYGYDHHHYPCRGYHHYPCGTSGWNDMSDKEDRKDYNSKDSWSWGNENIRPTSSQPLQTAYPAYNFESCLMNCDTETQYNPVCGTDGVSYVNPSVVYCARACGKNVGIAKFSICSSKGKTTIKPTTNIDNLVSTTPSQETIRVCILNCPTTSEYNPLCGTDGVTYTNPSRLECAQMCGVDVKFSKKYRCPAFGDIPSNPTSSSTPTPTTPTTAIPSTPTPMQNPSSTPPSTQDQSSSSPASSTSQGIDFTIPKEILDEVFTTTEAEYSIDERHEKK